MGQDLDFHTLFESYKAAVWRKDASALSALYGGAFVAFDTWMPWCLRGMEAWRSMNETWLSSLGPESVAVEFDNIDAHNGTDLGAATATVTFKAVAEDGSILRAMESRLTWVVRRIGDDWRIVHQHTSVPVDPDTMAAVLHR